MGKKKQFIKEKHQKKRSKVHNKYTKKCLKASQKTKRDNKKQPPLTPTQPVHNGKKTRNYNTFINHNNTI